MSRYVGAIVTGIVLCVALGVFGWISVTGVNPDRFMQMLLFMAPTFASLLGIQVAVKNHQTAEETKAIVAPTNGEYVERARAAYNAYMDATVGVHDGAAFDGLTDSEKRAWFAAVRAGNGEKVQ